MGSDIWKNRVDDEISPLGDPEGPFDGRMVKFCDDPDSPVESSPERPDDVPPEVLAIYDGKEKAVNVLRATCI